MTRAIKMTAINNQPGLLDEPTLTSLHLTRKTMTQAPTLSLLQQVAAGDQRAVADVIDSYGALVWSLAKRYFGRTAEAEDAVQDVFIAVWKAADRYDPGTAKESTFIAMIARRRMIDQLRKQGRRPSAATLEGSPEPEVESNDRLADEEQAEAVLTAINDLDPPQPEVIRRSILDGLTHAEIAEAMELPLGTVKTHIRRGLMKVRQALGIASPGSTGAHHE